MYSYLDKVHKSNENLLLEVDRICKKYDIHYYLHGGTYLGATRHKSFVPWDDDVDITMKRRDYENFISVFNKEKKDNFILLKDDEYDEFFDFIPKIADISVKYKKTAMGEDSFYNYRYNHPTLDIFILDTVYKRHKLQLILLKFIYALSMGHRPYVDYSKFKGISKVCAIILTNIGKIIPFKYTAKLYHKVQIMDNKYDDKSRFLFLSNEQPHPHYWGLVYSKKHYKTGHTSVINGNTYPSPYAPDKWLSYVYGNWKTLPNEEDRKPQHIIELE